MWWYLLKYVLRYLGNYLARGVGRLVGISMGRQSAGAHLGKRCVLSDCVRRSGPTGPVKERLNHWDDRQ